MKVRFQADSDLNQYIVAGVLRAEPAIDFRTAADASLFGLPDLQVLQIAAEDNRVLVSHDFKTMPAAFARHLQEDHSPGVFIVPQSLPLATAVEYLLMIWTASDAEEWLDRVCRIPL